MRSSSSAGELCRIRRHSCKLSVLAPTGLRIFAMLARSRRHNETRRARAFEQSVVTIQTRMAHNLLDLTTGHFNTPVTNRLIERAAQSGETFTQHDFATMNRSAIAQSIGCSRRVQRQPMRQCNQHDNG